MFNVDSGGDVCIVSIKLCKDASQEGGAGKTPKLAGSPGRKGKK